MIKRTLERLRNRSPKRVLIFGAYANGNLGDAEQAASVVRHLRAYSPDLEIVTASHSVANRLYYPDDAKVARNLRDIRDPEFVNSFDVLLVGGGGLLAAKHKPLENDEWLASINIPIVVFGVGANQEISELCSGLLKKAAIVTVRDQFSLDAVKPIRADVFIMRDPILMDRNLDRPFTDRPNPKRLGVIPRKLNRGSVERYYKSVGAQMLKRDAVITFFPDTDKNSGALDCFEGARVVPTTEMCSFHDAVLDMSVILSDRYHGCILGLKSGVRTLPLYREKIDLSSKIYALYCDLGIADQLYAANPVETRNQNFDLAERVIDPLKVQEVFKSWYDEFERTSKKIFKDINI
ncbi:polysaccharide pyruvyl transferase family protein [Roseibium aggregatum]|uniref:polysaccharide pyruvyl transferase family protein n=1 Tax=Roseibium aggregatum TaxID=187304 RepID=UPI003A97DCC9